MLPHTMTDALRVHPKDDRMSATADE
jgi:hypothetical protein